MSNATTETRSEARQQQRRVVRRYSFYIFRVPRPKEFPEFCDIGDLWNFTKRRFVRVKFGITGKHPATRKKMHERRVRRCLMRVGWIKVSDRETALRLEDRVRHATASNSSEIRGEWRTTCPLEVHEAATSFLEEQGISHQVVQAPLPTDHTKIDRWDQYHEQVMENYHQKCDEIARKMGH